MQDVCQKWVSEVFQNAEEEESGLFEEGETKGKKNNKRTRSKWATGNRESPVFSCISFLDSCLLDDRIKESFNMTSVLYFDINTPHTPL